LERLRELLARIRRDVPFFEDRAAIYDPCRVDDLKSFSALPYMRKRDLRRNFPRGLISRTVDLAAGLAEGRLSVLATSGTTDDRIQIVTRTMIDRLPFGSDDLLGISIGSKQPRTAILTTPVCASVACRRADGSFEERLSSTSPDLYLKTTANPF